MNPVLLNYDHKFYGVWQEEGLERGLQLDLCIGNEQKLPDIEKIIDYLKVSPKVLVSPVKDWCLCCKWESTEYAWRSDGTWLWRAPLFHYVQDHQVQLPPTLVEQIRAANYSAPKSVI